MQGKVWSSVCVCFWWGKYDRKSWTCLKANGLKIKEMKHLVNEAQGSNYPAHRPNPAPACFVNEDQVEHSSPTIYLCIVPDCFCKKAGLKNCNKNHLTLHRKVYWPLNRLLLELGGDRISKSRQGSLGKNRKCVIWQRSVKKRER